MGVDFIERASRTFVKHLDLAQARLAAADLFTRSPIENRPSFPVQCAPNANLQPGQELTVEANGKALVFRLVLAVVATIDTPANDILDAVQNSCGIATAIVQEVHDLSGIAEVTLC